MESIKDMLALWPGVVVHYEFTLPHPIMPGYLVSVKLLSINRYTTDILLAFNAFNTLGLRTTVEVRVPAGVTQHDLFHIIEEFMTLFKESERMNEILKAIPKAPVYTMRTLFYDLDKLKLEVKVKKEGSEKGIVRDIAFGASEQVIMDTIKDSLEQLMIAERHQTAAFEAMIRNRVDQG